MHWSINRFIDKIRNDYINHFGSCLKTRVLDNSLQQPRLAFFYHYETFFLARTAHQITCTELGKAEEKVERYAKLLHMFCSLRYTVAYLWTHFVYFVNFHLKRKKIVHHLHNNQSFLGYGKHLNRGWKKIGNSAEM